MDRTDATEQAGGGLLRRLLGGAVTTVWVVGALVLGVYLWPTSFGGCTTLTIVSGRSMEPTYHSGDLVVARCGPVAVGDVAVYEAPGTEGARVIHRVVDGAPDGWVLRGDNNDFLDPWLPTDGDVLGTARHHLPGVGTVAWVLVSPAAWASLLLVAAAIALWPGRDPAPAATGTTGAPDVDLAAATGTDVAVAVRPEEGGVRLLAGDPVRAPH